MKKQTIKNKKKKSGFKSRKIIMAAVAVIVAFSAFAQKEIGISMNSGQAAMSLGVIIAYLFGEFKSDMARLRITVFQGQKFHDPAFWSALVCSQLPVINTITGWDLPVEGINSVMVCILGLVFKSRVGKLKEVE